MIINVATGEIKQQIKYDEFGNVLSQSGSIELPFGYAGGMYDKETKLVRFGARDYDANIGRWTAKDPIFFKGGDLNIFSYVINDPLNYKDNAGTYPEDVYKYLLENTQSVIEMTKTLRDIRDNYRNMNEINMGKKNVLNIIRSAYGEARVLMIIETPWGIIDLGNFWETMHNRPLW